MHRVTNCLISSQATALKYNVGGSYDQIMYFLYKIAIDTSNAGVIGWCSHRKYDIEHDQKIIMDHPDQLKKKLERSL